MTEAYRIAVTARAARVLERLPEKLAVACVEFLFGPLADNPQRVGKALRAKLSGSYSARRGDYRVVYAIRVDDRVVEVEHIDRRSDTFG